jgi:hypothetical protein
MNSRKLAIAGAVLATVATGFGITNSGPAEAADGRPYGGCKELTQEWPSAEGTPGAAWCARHGWTVRHRFVLDPTNRVRMLWLPSCKHEDSRGCYWNAPAMGNGRGASFIRTKRGRTFYVHFPVSPEAELVGV